MSTVRLNYHIGEKTAGKMDWLIERQFPDLPRMTRWFSLCRIPPFRRSDSFNRSTAKRWKSKSIDTVADKRNRPRNSPKDDSIRREELEIMRPGFGSRKNPCLHHVMAV